MIEFICDKLNIEIGKEWTGNDWKTYFLDIDGRLCEVKEDEIIDVSYKLRDLIMGDLKPVK